MNQKTVVNRIRRMCEQQRSQAAVAVYFGVSQAYISDILCGKRQPGPAILTKLGLTRRVSYDYQPTNGS